MKKWASLLLAFTLCLSLTVPTMAAGADGLTAAEAKSYMNELDKINATIQYAGLMDMDKNGKPELVAVTLTNPDEYSYDHHDTAEVYIWTIKNGSAVKTVQESVETFYSSVTKIYKAASRDGQIYIWCTSWDQYRIYETFIETCVGVNGKCGDFYYSNGAELGEINGRYVENFKTEYFKVVSALGRSQPQGNTGYSDVYPVYKEDIKINSADLLLQSDINEGFLYDDGLADSVQETRTQLSKKVNSSVSVPAASTYGEYTIILDYATVTFESAKVEKKYINFSYEDWDGLVDLGKKYTTVVTVKPGSYIKIVGFPYGMDSFDGKGWVTGKPGTVVGENHFKMGYIGAVEPMLIDGVAEKSFQSPNDVYCINIDTYVLLGNTVGDFLDVSADEYYAKPVEWAVKKKITSGTSATTFSPNSTCTNAQILTFLWKANGSPAPTISNPFSNIKTSDYYYKPALWAYQNGMVSGKTFNSNAPCTRSQTVMYMWQSAGKPTTKNTVSFTDVSSNASYAKAVAWAVKEGITAGTSATTFSPNSTCTRGQIVTFLYNYFG